MKRLLFFSVFVTLVIGVAIEIVGSKKEVIVAQTPEAMTVIEVEQVDNVYCGGEPLDGPCVLICEYCYSGGIASKHFGSILVGAWGRCPVCGKYIAFE